MNKVATYQNGNADIELFEDGTRIIQFEDNLKLDYPLNIDIRVSTKCAFGLNPSTGKSFCSFCHESATTDGKECDFEKLKDKLKGLPEGIELAIGANELTEKLYNFLVWCHYQGFICNLTINQGHIKRDILRLASVIDNNYIKGLGISYRSELKFDIPKYILDYSNTVFHVISGIDTYQNIEDLSTKGVKKILILGEKDFGFNQGKVDLTSKTHKEWYWWVHKLFSKFEVVSFDNLALEQLNIRRFFTNENWEVFNNGEHSFYINAVNHYFSPSSRNLNKTNWDNLTVQDYFIQLNKKYDSR
jgi:hypothetical protein